jgi:hypothetical protein
MHLQREKERVWLHGVPTNPLRSRRSESEEIRSGGKRKGENRKEKRKRNIGRQSSREKKEEAACPQRPVWTTGQH